MNLELMPNGSGQDRACFKHKVMVWGDDPKGRCCVARDVGIAYHRYREVLQGHHSYVNVPHSRIALWLKVQCESVWRDYMVGFFTGATALRSALDTSEDRSVKRQIRDALDLAISRYPSKGLEIVNGMQYDLNTLMRSSIQRFAYHLDIIVRSIPKGGRVADVGGGLTPHCHALALLGYRSVLVDDFGDRWHGDAAEVLEGQKRDGVEVVSCDLIQGGLTLEANSFDAIMTFDCLEHLHHSPKKMLTECVAALKPGGLFFLGVPNCVNLRKRLTVPFGIGKWSRMEEWYEEGVFRGHVREPDVDDLHYIADSLGLQNVKIIGMNWLGYDSRFAFVRLLVPFADRLLQFRPTLCANIYLIGTKQAV